MLLFGKKSFRATPRSVAERLRDIVTPCPEPGLSAAREWLVFAGQLEQAVLDLGGSAEVATITDAAAELFLAIRKGNHGAPQRKTLLRALSDVCLPDSPAEFRIPEGFAWYALYPDSYAETAERWATAHAGARVLVIGLRSIGTSLSATVAGALAGAGSEVAGRWTVRPSGHPFERVWQSDLAVPEADAAIIVDEGPGLSGSSMAGVAEGLKKSGMREESVLFFPGHDRGPGPAGRPEAKRWWTSQRCWVSATPRDLFPPTQDLRWIFGGLAAVNGRLDTLAEVKRRRHNRLADLGLALPSPSAGNGWIAIEDEGQTLISCALDENFIRGTLARYIAAAALPPVEQGVVREALHRIAEALASQAPGARLVERALAGCRGLPLAGDGRLAPAEWARLDDGRLVKRDATGTDCDHTWAGPQSILWDVAGAAVEWQMDEKQLNMLLQSLETEHGIGAERFSLSFHRAGYSCLQLARTRHEGDVENAMRYEAALSGALRELEVLA